MRPAWQALAAHYDQVSQRHLRQLFADDPARGERLTATAVGIALDYSKNRVTDETRRVDGAHRQAPSQHRQHRHRPCDLRAARP